jgi:hypothetical protein
MNVKTTLFQRPPNPTDFSDLDGVGSTFMISDDRQYYPMAREKQKTAHDVCWHEKKGMYLALTPFVLATFHLAGYHGYKFMRMAFPR